MASTLGIIGDSLKGAFSKLNIARRLSFMPQAWSGGSGNSGSGGNVGFMAGGLVHRGLAGMNGGDFEALCPDVLENSVVAACVNAIAQALPEAPLLLEERVGDNEFRAIDCHPVLDLLRNPNPYLSEAELWGITTAFERTRGEAFWYFEYDAAGDVPREIWFRAPQFVTVLSDSSRFISGYRIQAENGVAVNLDESDVVHFRHQLSPYNPRAGWNPIQTGKRQIVGDNGAATYHSSILRNAGAASLIISLKDAAAAGEVTPGQLQEYVDQFKRKVSGEGAGAILGLDLPLDVHKVGFSPDEMALEKILEYYESRICALMGVNRRVINLGSDPTYENSKVALNDFWERTIVPMRRRHASTLSSQLLPLFGLDSAQYRLRFDFSEVEALRENLDALHARWRETFAAGGIDLFTFQEKIGLKPDEKYRGRYVKASVAFDEGGDGDEVKAKRNNSGSSRFDPAEHPRGQPDNAGQFVSSGGRDATTEKYFNGNFKVEFEDQHKVDELSKALFGRETPLPAKDWGELAGAPDGSIVKVVPSTVFHGGVQIEVNHGQLIDSSLAGATQTIHAAGSKGAVSFYEWITIKKTGEALGQRMMLHTIEKARELGLKYVYLHAAGGPKSDMRGFDIWARLGFNTALSDNTKDALPPTLRGANSINDLMKTKEGPQWWSQNGQDFRGSFTLDARSHNGSNNDTVMREYMKEKGVKI